MPRVERTRRGLVQALLTLLACLAAAPSHGGTLDLSWNEPTRNADGTPLTDLTGYRIYWGSTTPGCRGNSHSVTATTASPRSGSVVSYSMSGLTAGATYSVQVTAVDDAGNESGCPTAATGVARAAVTASPAGSIAFGSVAVGAVLDRTLVVQNVSNATLSGTASASGPFSIASGQAFTLPPGGNQNVVVRFRPTVSGTAASNVTLTGGGDSISRVVSGTGTGTGAGSGASTLPPMATLTVSRTGNGTVTSSPAGVTCGATCTFRFAAGSRVNLAAVAASGSRFSGWNGACQGTATCSVVLNGNLTVGAAFTTTTNPAPTLATLAPSTATAGNGGVTLTVNGGNFVAASVVRWNGSPRTTTYVNATQLRAAIPAADLARAGTAQVSVVTPSPGGGTSVNRAFTVAAAPSVPGNTAPSTTVREIVVDNAQAGVQDRAGGRTFTGQWCRSESPQPYGADSLYSCGSGQDAYRWTPNVPVPGMYDVYIWMTGRAARSRRVPVTVVHVGGTTTREFDQTLGGGRWVLHGRYRFYDGPGGYVEISDRNGSAGADAIRLSGPR